MSAGPLSFLLRLAVPLAWTAFACNRLAARLDAAEHVRSDAEPAR
jgi:hypothetical protein